MDRTEKFVLGGLALFLFGVVVSSVVFISTLGRTVEKQDTAALQPQPRVAKQAVVAPIVNADRAVEFQPIAIEKSNEALVFGVPTPAKTEHDWELCSGRLDKLNKKLARLGRQLVAERNEEGYLIDNALCPSCHLEYDRYRKHLQRLARKRISRKQEEVLFNGRV